MCPGSGSASATSDRLTQVSGHLEKLVLDPNSESFPKYKDLPRYPGEPEGAAWLWGKDDEVRCCCKLSRVSKGQLTADICSSDV
jgi:hypothetical protein